MNKHKVSMGIGLSTLMMVFTVLCLTIFATLSFLQARRNLKESDLIVNSSIEYYAADYKASIIYEDLLDNCNNLVYLNENNIEVKDNIYSYSIQINDKSTLDIKLEYNDGLFTILSWQEVAHNDGGYDYHGFVH